MAGKPPRVVAELGRPETAEETAARKAENSRRHRANQTVRNLVFALIASLGVVLLLVLVVVRPDQPTREPVDWSAVAAQAQPSVDAPLADPVLPDAWVSNSATLDVSARAISVWYIGFITPDEQFIGLRQGIDADGSWGRDQVNNAQPTTTTVIDGVEWEVFDRREIDDPGNLAYAMRAEIAGSTVVLFGTAEDAAFLTLAASTVAALPTDGDSSDQEGGAP